LIAPPRIESLGMPADRRGFRNQLQTQRIDEGDDASGAGEPMKGKGKSKGKGNGKGKASTNGASSADSPNHEPPPPPVWLQLDGVPFALLPCEAPLADALRKLATTTSAAERDAAMLAALRDHPFIEVKGPQGGRAPFDFGAKLGNCIEEHFRMDVRGFQRWLRTEEGRPFLKQAGGPSDDGLYTVSAVLRRCMSRGLSRFTFSAAPGEEVVVRGFRKFTGLTADDEDEESGATNMYEDFYYTSNVSAAHFAVTTKSNGENGKFSVRRVNGELLFFAGSKNTCLAWRGSDDVTQLHPAVDASIPGPSIAAAMQRFWKGWTQGERDEFAAKAASESWTLMLESNCSNHEHVFPIPKDFVEFVAILDREGLPVPQKQAFAFFDSFGLPRVRCDEGIPMADLGKRLAEERCAVDREGAVLYLEAADGSPIGLLKVKSNFYVRARRTRMTFWGAVVDPLLRGDDLDVIDDELAPKGSSKGKRPSRKSRGGVGWSEAERRLRNGMKDLKHVEGCVDNWEEWAEVAVGFIQWWRLKFNRATEEEKKQVIKDAKARFGSTYRDYCRDAKIPGGEN